MNNELQVVKPPDMPVQVAPQSPSALSILEAAVRGGINKENMDVVERLVALRRDEMKEQAKAEFSRAFLQLRRNMPEIYVDSAAKDSSGNVAYRYCSEREISERLEPVLLANGFAMLAGQRQDAGLVTVSITLIHEAGHQEVREYTVHPGGTNRMKDATAADTSATTSAWRHLVTKMFGLKSRMREQDDPRLVGERISESDAVELKRLCSETGTVEAAFLKFAGAVSFDAIHSSRLPQLKDWLEKRQSRKINLAEATALRARVTATGADEKDFLNSLGVEKYGDIRAAQLPTINQMLEKLEGTK